MFFFRKRGVIFFGRGTIFIAEVNRFGKCIPSSRRGFFWTKETLPSVLRDMCVMLPHRIRLILSEEWVYSIVAPLSKKEACDRSCVALAIRDRIPDDLADTIWDYSFMKASRFAVNPETFIHAVVAKKTLFNDIIEPLRASGFFIESIDAESCSIAKLFRSEREPIILGRGETDGRTLLLAIHQGPPLATEIIEPERADEVGRFVEFAKGRSGVGFARAYCSPLVPESIRKALGNAGLAVEVRDFDLCAGAMMKRRLFGKDQSVLNLAK